VKLPENHGWLTISEPPKPGSQLLDYVTHVERRSELRALFEAVLENGKPQEIRAVQPDGNHWLMKVAPWQHQGEIRGLIYIVTDQTEFHALQTQLHQAQKLETIGTLAAGVAHEFNNLLQAIRGNASLVLLHHQLPETLRDRLESIDQAAIRATVITQQLLSFSQASDEAGNLLDFNEVIAECGDFFKHSLLNKVELRLRPTSSPLKVRIDHTCAHRLLLNLFVNAQDAMPNGGQLTLTNLLVRLNATQAAIAGVPSGTNFVKCSVSDTGTGMPEDVVSRIFDPFFTTKAQGEGIGLGLFIVHSIATKADGFLEVESTIGRGTTFHIYLPSFEEKLTDETPLTNLPVAKASARVLVVDDLDLVLDFARSFLEASGYEVLVATSGEQALGILEKEQTPVNLLFTDYNMPGMSGRQLIHQAAASWPEMKFILTSGFLEDDDRRQIEKEYGARILDKPFNISEAAGLIAEMLAS
jgi:signal transduction histidine kinase/CheY-like chemotaxis protein